MSKAAYIIPAIILATGAVSSCNAVKPETANRTTQVRSDNQNSERAIHFEIKSDRQYPLIEFLTEYPLPEALDEFKKGMVAKAVLQQKALEEKLGRRGIVPGFRKVNYLYKSTGVNGEPIVLSATACWRGYFEDGKWNDIEPDDICLMEHYTITSDAECPSNSFPLEMFVTGNTLTLMPDHLGYGETSGMPHPYLDYGVCAANSIDALEAGNAMFGEVSKCGMAEGWELYIAGASQGAGNALAAHMYMEFHTEIARKWNFAKTVCSSGPFSPVITFERYIADEKVVYPVVFPLVVKAMFASNPEIMEGFTEEMVYSDNYLTAKQEIDRMIASKEYDTAAINRIFLEKVKKRNDGDIAGNEIYLSDILSPAMMDKESDIAKAFRLCLLKNELTRGWQPQHPIKIHYSAADKVVPHENALAVQEAFGDKIVTIEETAMPADHTTACTLWMTELFSKGF